MRLTSTETSPHRTCVWSRHVAHGPPPPILNQLVGLDKYPMLSPCFKIPHTLDRTIMLSCNYKHYILLKNTYHHMFLIIIIKVYLFYFNKMRVSVMSVICITKTQTIHVLRSFSYHSEYGKVLLLGNWGQFFSLRFQQFLKENGITLQQ